MAPKYTLHYFQIPGRGEFIRVIFNHAGVEFENKTYPLRDLPKIRADEKNYPLGQVPVLEFENGELLVESHAIIRYLAREFDLYGQSNQDRVVIDQTMDSLKTVEENLSAAYFFTKDPEEKKQKLKGVFENFLPRVLRLIESFIKKNNDGKSFLVGDSITIGDIQILVALELILQPENEHYRNILDNYPLIKGVFERIQNSPRIKEYLNKRGPRIYNFGF